MAEKQIVIDEEYRKQMAVDAEVHKDNIQGDLLTLTKKLVRYTTDLDRLLRSCKKAEQEYDEVCAQRYSYLRFKGDVVCSEKDADKMIKADPECIAKKKEWEALEADFKLVNDYKEVLKQGYWNIKSYIDYEKFKAGEMN